MASAEGPRRAGPTPRARRLGRSRGWRPRLAVGERRAFARAVVARPSRRRRRGRRRFCSPPGRLARFGESVGLEPSPGLLLHGSVIERFIVVGCRTVSPATRRTLRDQPARASPRARGRAAAGRGGAAAGARQAPLRRGRDRGLPPPGGGATDPGAADARQRAGLPRGGRGPGRAGAAPPAG